MPSDTLCRIAGLHVYPVKSFAGIALDEAVLTDTGVDLDRAWMVVDAEGEMLTQRDAPRMALVACAFKANDVVLRAPGMLALHLNIDAAEAATRVRVWGEEVRAFDMGALAAQWASDFLGRQVRLARFDPDEHRYADRKWTGELAAENMFSDGFPILVAGAASLADLNARLAAAGAAAVTMARFRPNVVLEGIPAFEEDHIDEIAFDCAEGAVRLKLVKPCARCTIPDVNPLDASTGTTVGDALRGFRADARVGGAVTFGMNAIVAEGFGCTLRVGQQGRVSLKV
jgi:uncharacterized protein YcbX